MKRQIFTDSKIDAQFKRDGYVVLDLLQSHDIEKLLSLYQTHAKVHSSDFFASILSSDTSAREKIHQGISEIFTARTKDILHEYRIAVGSFAVKQPSTERSEVGLHQDVSFIEERDGHVGLSLWCPLVDVIEKNGYLGVVPGSHLANQNYRDSCTLPYPDLVKTIWEDYLEFQEMKAGQLLVMDSRVFHGSPPNRSNIPRVVAAGVGVPAESQLIYCHRNWAADDGQLEVFEVGPDHYIHHQFGQKPNEGKHLTTVPREVTPLTEETLQKLCRAAG